MNNVQKKNQLVILSGKGGTGKTTLASAFSWLAKSCVTTDCDVDAADLFILLKPAQKEKTEFYGGKKAKINRDICTQCGLCERLCRFEAIKDLIVDDMLCEGCGFCFRICEVNAIEFTKVISGSYYDCRVHNDNEFLYADLLPGEGNSGKLVTELKKKASTYYLQNGKEWYIVDGPPGIGCPVNASISGANLVLIIIEPTLSGLHDLKRIIQLIKLFKIKVSVVINKYDLNEDLTETIEHYLNSEHIPLAGKILFDETVVFSLQQEKCIMDFPDSKAAKQMTEIWHSIQNYQR
jgi:MinD superfamily P-loop ATPase